MDESESDIATDVNETAGEETDKACTTGWEKSLEGIGLLCDKQSVNSLKERQLGLLAAGVEQAIHWREREAEEVCEHLLEETREWWLSLGMLREEDSHLLESVNGPYHPNILQSREEYFARERAEDDEWALDKERDLRDYQKQVDKDDNQKRALSALFPWQIVSFLSLWNSAFSVHKNGYHGCKNVYIKSWLK